MKTTSKKKALCQVVITWTIGFGIAFAVAFWCDERAVRFHGEVRGYLFSGFLTLGSFLLTTKTFVITRLQEGLFHTAKYDELHKAAIAQLGAERAGARNEGLRQLTEFLVWSVFSCMLTAVAELLLASFESRLGSSIALALGAGSLALVLRSWFVIRDLMHRYLEIANGQPLKS